MESQTPSSNLELRLKAAYDQARAFTRNALPPHREEELIGLTQRAYELGLQLADSEDPGPAIYEIADILHRTSELSSRLNQAQKLSEPNYPTIRHLTTLSLRTLQARNALRDYAAENANIFLQS